MARTEHTVAVVLRTVAYGDSDRVVTLLTERRGKLAVLARGARRSARRFAGALEPVALIEAEIAQGRGELGRLAQARVLRAFPGVLADLERISIAAAGLELVREALADGEPDARLLPAIERFFELVEREPLGDELGLAFALRVLALVGLTPNLRSCGRCARSVPEGKAALFSPDLGAVVCRACGGGPVLLTGAVRDRMDLAGGRTWDEQAVTRWRDVAAARRAVDELCARHLPHRLEGGQLVEQVREVRRASPRAQA